MPGSARKNVLCSVIALTATLIALSGAYPALAKMSVGQYEPIGTSFNELDAMADVHECQLGALDSCIRSAKYYFQHLQSDAGLLIAAETAYRACNRPSYAARNVWACKRAAEIYIASGRETEGVNMLAYICRQPFLMRGFSCFALGMAYLAPDQLDGENLHEASRWLDIACRSGTLEFDAEPCATAVSAYRNLAASANTEEERTRALQSAAELCELRSLEINHLCGDAPKGTTAVD